MSFDDRSIDEWFKLRKLFNENQVKVTFFITQPDSLSSTELDKLRILEKDGHEIGFHGNMHVSAESYIKEKSLVDYLDKEINMGMRAMDSLGFNCVSFAYPYGSKYWFTDFLLLKKFNFIRGVSGLNYEKDLTKIDGIYYSFENEKILSAIGIDVNSGIDEGMIDRALNRAVNKKEILMLYAHTPAKLNEAKGYSFDIEFLRHIIEKANEKDIHFYTTKELKTKYNNP